MKRTELNCIKNGIKLYNVIFPIWWIIILPPTWLIVLPANFVLGFAVIFFTLKYLGVENPKEITKSIIVKTWLCGFAADFLGAILMLVAGFNSGNTKFFRMIERAMFNPFANIYAFGWVVLCTVLTAVLIYALNRSFCLTDLKTTDDNKKKVALSLAIFTAPYLFFLPTF